VLLLYLVSPVYVSALPIDDGNLFSKWREMFLAKLFAGFGTVFTMKIFLVIVPLISGSSITLYADPNIDAMLKLFIIIGGAWAAFRAQNLFLQILHPEAAFAAQATMMAMFGMAGMAMRGAAALVIPQRGSGGGSSAKGGADKTNRHRRNSSCSARLRARDSRPRGKARPLRDVSRPNISDRTGVGQYANHLSGPFFKDPQLGP
jgi:hypothetical protein